LGTSGCGCLVFLFSVTNFDPKVLTLKRFSVVEKEQNVPISYFKLMQFLLVGTQKYYLPLGPGNPNYTTERYRRFVTASRLPLASGGWDFSTKPPTSNGEMLATIYDVRKF